MDTLGKVAEVSGDHTAVGKRLSADVEDVDDVASLLGPRILPWILKEYVNGYA